MWNKPKEITNNKFLPSGYEISGTGYSNDDAVIQGWYKSSGHKVVMLTQGNWAGLKTLGCGKNGRIYQSELNSLRIIPCSQFR